MARVIDLKHASPPEDPPKPPVIPHPVMQEKKILTDIGEKTSFDTLRWSAPTHYRRPGSVAGFWFGLCIVILAVIVAIFWGDIMQTILFSLIGILIMTSARRAVPVVNVELDPAGVTVGRKTYHYEDMKSFCVHNDPRSDIRELSLHMKKWTSPYIKIQLGDADPVQVQAFLLEYVPEEKHENMLVHGFARWLGL